MTNNLKRKKVSFRKSGSGSLTPSITIPITWLRKLGIDEVNRDISVYFTGDEIILRKN